MLKEYIANDIDQTFFNDGEFSETATLNGVEVEIVQDAERLALRIKQDYDGLSIGDILFFIKENALKEIPRMTFPPRAGDAVNIDGKASVITNAAYYMGVYELTLQYTGGR